MPKINCVASLLKKYPDMNKAEIETLQAEILERIAEARAKGIDPTSYFNSAIANKKLTIQHSKRQAVINVEKRNSALTTMANFEDPIVALNATVVPDVGKNKFVSSTSSAETKMNAIKSRAASIITQTLDEVSGAYKAFTSGMNDRFVFRKFYDTSSVGDSLEEAAYKAIKNYGDYDLNTKRKVGFNVQENKRWITKLMHPSKMIKRLGDDEFRSLAMKTWDFEKMGIPTEKVDDFVSKFYNKRTDIRTSRVLDEGMEVVSFKMGKGVEANRSIIFKDGDAHYDYFNAVHEGKTLAAVVSENMHREYGRLALADTFGPNYKATILSLKNAAAKAANAKGQSPSIIGTKIKQFDQYIGMMENKYPSHGTSLVAKFGDTSRKLVNMAMLGKALISTITDLPQSFMTINTVTGKNIFQTTNEVLSDFVSNIPRESRRELANKLQVFSEDYLSGFMLRRFGSDDGPVGRGFDKWHNFYMQATGLTDQSHIMRSVIAKNLADHFGTQQLKSFDELYRGAKDSLSRFGINSKEWDIIRNSELETVGKTQVLTPESIRNQKGINANRLDEIATNYAAYLDYYSKRGSPTPGMKQNRWQRVVDPNTVTGQLMRFAGQFKSFSLSVMETMQAQKNIGATSSLGNMDKVAATIAMASVGGYLAEQMSSFTSRGEFKPFPSNTKEALDTVTRAVARGGALGLYDYLLASRGGGYRPISADIGGPFMAMLNDAAQLVSESGSTIGDLISGNKFDKKIVKDSIKMFEKYFPTLPFIGPFINYKLASGLYNVSGIRRPIKQKKFGDKSKFFNN